MSWHKGMCAIPNDMSWHKGTFAIRSSRLILEVGGTRGLHQSADDILQNCCPVRKANKEAIISESAERINNACRSTEAFATALENYKQLKSHCTTAANLENFMASETKHHVAPRPMPPYIGAGGEKGGRVLGLNPQLLQHNGRYYKHASTFCDVIDTTCEVRVEVAINQEFQKQAGITAAKRPCLHLDGKVPGDPRVATGCSSPGRSSCTRSHNRICPGIHCGMCQAHHTVIHC